MADRPLVAFVCNALTPYRLHLHRRIVREVTEIELWSLFTHGESNAPWSQSAPADINPVEFGAGQKALEWEPLRLALHEWRKGGRVIRWLNDNGASAVVVFGYNDAGRLRILRWCHRHGMPCFLFGDSNIRGDRTAGLTGWLKRRILPRVLGWCSGVLPCGFLGQAYFARYGVPAERMFLFPYEPDYDRIARVTPADVDAVRQRWGFSLERHYLLFSGRLAAQKRVDLLVDAFAAIAANRPGWDLVLAGDGPLTDALKKRVPPALTGRVHWLGFIDDQDTLSALYRIVNVLVLPSDYEPWAVVVNEAVAAELAVVATDTVGAAAELVRDGVNGRLFGVGDLEALIGCLRDVTDRERCAVMQAASPAMLAEWRRRADPIRGLRAALIRSRVLSGVIRNHSDR